MGKNALRLLLSGLRRVGYSDQKIIASTTAVWEAQGDSGATLRKKKAALLKLLLEV